VKLLWWIILLPLVALVAALAVANRLPVTIDFDPFPLSLEAPLYIVVMSSLALGLFIGALAAWLAAGRRRRETRRLRRNVKMMETELDGLRARLAEPVAEPAAADEDRKLEQA
jgi:uncharacterized integral membrane protein